MKVCLLNDSFPPVIDGVANTVMNYAEILTKKEGVETIVATPRYPDTQYDSYPYRVVPYQSFDTTSIVKGYRAGNPLAVSAIDEMSAFMPDIIHSHCPVSSTIMARILRNETDAPIVFTYHTKFDYDIARAVKAKIIRRESARALVNNIESCDEVWVVSRGAGDNLRSLGFEGDVRVMANGVDFPKGRATDEAVKKACEGYDLPEGVPVYLFVGRIMNYKGLPIILDAMKILSDEGKDFRCVFVGGGADLDGLKSKTEEYGIKDRVFFTGPIYDREALRAWNTRADLFLFPSTYDTNGIVVREAAACGLASVLIKDSCAAEGITHDRNGFIIEENAESMAALLRDAGSDIVHLKEAGQRAMDEIYISWEDAVKNAYSRYEDIIELKKQGIFEKRRHRKTGFVLNIAADLAGGTEEVFRAPKRIYEGMRDNYNELMDDMQEIHKNARESFRYIGHEVKEGAKRVKKEIKDSAYESFEKFDTLKERVEKGG